jgi:hypothetical protein
MDYEGANNQPNTNTTATPQPSDTPITQDTTNNTDTQKNPNNTIPQLTHRQNPIAAGNAFDGIAGQGTDG